MKVSLRETIKIECFQSIGVCVCVCVCVCVRGFLNIPSGPFTSVSEWQSCGQCEWALGLFLGFCVSLVWILVKQSLFQFFPTKPQSSAAVIDVLLNSRFISTTLTIHVINAIFKRAQSRKATNPERLGPQITKALLLQNRLCFFPLILTIAAKLISLFSVLHGQKVSCAVVCGVPLKGSKACCEARQSQGRVTRVSAQSGHQSDCTSAVYTSQQNIPNRINPQKPILAWLSISPGTFGSAFQCCLLCSQKKRKWLSYCSLRVSRGITIFRILLGISFQDIFPIFIGNGKPLPGIPMWTKNRDVSAYHQHNVPSGTLC